MADFKATEISRILVKAEQYWRDSQALTNQIPLAVDSVKAILSNQNARFEEYTGSNKKRKIGISFITNCDADTQDVTASCSIEGGQLDSAVEEYDYNLSQEHSFSVPHFLDRTNEYSTEEVIARGLMDGKKLLDNWLAKTTLARLATFKGVNKYPHPWTFDAATVSTNVPPANWTEKMVGNLIQQAQLNNINNAYYISDGLLYVPFLDAGFDGPNAEGKGNFARARALNLHFDQVNFNKAGVDDNLFMIDKSAVALKTKAWFDRRPTNLADKLVWSVPSDYLPGVEYDVEYQFKCSVVGGEEVYSHHFRLRTYGVFAQNPIACENTTTGVLGYRAFEAEAAEPEE